ncbi:SRPBCC family protein [Jatrophihabitans fulvus]
MSVLTLSAKGGLPPDEVWQRYAQLSRWTNWSPQLTRVDATDDELAFGVSGRVFGPLGVHADFVVESYDEANRQWSWAVRRWPLTVRLDHAVTKRGGGSMTTLRLDGPLPVIVGYAPVAQLALHRLVTKEDA